MNWKRLKLNGIAVVSAFLIAAQGCCVFAEGVDVDSKTNNVVIEGAIPPGNTGNVASILLVRNSTGAMAYINEALISNGKYFHKFKFNAGNIADYTLRVNAGGQDVTEYVLQAAVHSSMMECVFTLDAENANKYFNGGDDISIKATVKNVYDDAFSCKLIIAAFDVNGRILDVQIGENMNVAYAANGDLTVLSLGDYTLPENTEQVKLFAWKSGDTQIPMGKNRTQQSGDLSYQDGDVVAFMGDSITHGGIYHYFIEHYYQTRYPDRKIEFYNKGINGNVASEVLKRLDWDVLVEGENRVTLMIGVNDVAPTVQSDPNASADAKLWYINRAASNIETVVQACIERNIEIRLVTPPLYDENPALTGYLFGGTNAALTQLSQMVKNIGTRNGVKVYDVNSMTNAITQYGNSLGHRLVITGEDRTHPAEVGSTLIGYCFLKEQGAISDVASVNIDAAAQTAQGKNAAVSDLNAAANGVSFLYAPKASPLAANASYNGALVFAPNLTNELNKEILQVSGLEAGTYKLLLGGVQAGEYSALSLQSGVNIAVLAQNPNQIRAQQAYNKLMDRCEQTRILRSIIVTEQCADGKYALQTPEGYASFLADNTTHPYLADFTAYAARKPIENTTKALAKSYSEQAAALSAPTQYTVSIVKK